MTMVFVMSGLAACGVGLLFALFLAKPLYSILGEACSANGRSSAFWTAYSTSMMLLSPALGVLFMASFKYHNLPPEVLFARTLFLGLLCLLAALLVIGVMMAYAAFKQPGGVIATDAPAAAPVREA